METELENLEVATVRWFLNHHKMKEEARRKIVADMGLSPGDRVLDLASGPGVWANLFADRVGSTGSVICIDRDATLLAYGRQAASQHELYRRVLQFQEGDCHKIPQEDNSFDFAFLANTLLYLERPDLVLQEMKRVTKPGGRIALKDFDGATFLVHPIPPCLFARLQEAVARAFDEDPPQGHTDNYPGRKLHGLLREAGLKDISLKTYATQKIPPLSEETIGYVGGNLQWYLEVVGDRISAQDREQWQRYLDPNSSEYVFHCPDFYFSMLEMVAIATVISNK